MPHRSARDRFSAEKPYNALFPHGRLPLFPGACPQIGGDEPEFSGPVIRPQWRGGGISLHQRCGLSGGSDSCRRGAGQRLRLALRFRRLLSDWARGPNRWPRSGGGFMWLRTRPSSRVVRIGNSRGIRIPKALRDEASLPEEVELHAEPGRLIVQAVRHPRTGWAAAAKRMRARGDDRLNEPVATKFDRAEWEWR